VGFHRQLSGLFQNFSSSKKTSYFCASSDKFRQTAVRLAKETNHLFGSECFFNTEPPLDQLEIERDAKRKKGIVEYRPAEPERASNGPVTAVQLAAAIYVDKPQYSPDNRSQLCFGF
jgi:hypothetical protein